MLASSFSQLQPSSGDKAAWLIEPLSEVHNQAYYDAMKESQWMLFETLGWGWPTTKMSAEQNLDTMRFHVEQHQLKAAYSYVILDSSNNQLRGAVFIAPAQRRSGLTGYTAAEYSAEVTFWLNEAGQRSSYAADLVPQLLQWLTNDWSMGMVLFPVAEQNVFTRHHLEAAGLSTLSRRYTDNERLYQFDAR